MPDPHREILCPLCGSRMVYGRVELERPMRGRLAWSSQGEYATAPPEKSSPGTATVPASRKSEVEAFRCPNCTALLFGPNRWS